MTLGEYRVGITFNPSADDRVNKIKTMAAAAIDFLEEQKPTMHDTEGLRLISLAQTHIEDAAMWGVKAVTKGPMP